jgi:hypothetical protein
MLIAGLFATPGMLLLVTRAGGQTPSSSPERSLAAWETIAAVLQHPRCLNCHQMDSPSQGDARRPHKPRVVRGPDNHGVSAMRCGNCHSESTNNPDSGVPGALHWQLAPRTMSWQGLSLPKSQIRAYRWCSPPRIGCAIISPNRSIGRLQSASFPSERCVRTSL